MAASTKSQRTTKLLEQLSRNSRTLGCLLDYDDVIAPVSVSNCNATGGWAFSNASVTFTLGNSLPLSFLMLNGIESVIKMYQDGSSFDKFTDCLLEYINTLEDNHMKCLNTLNNETHKSEHVIQAVLAVHLFAPLVPDSKYTIDSHFPLKMKKQCPSCGVELCLGNTSFGNTSVWHGNADIVIERSVVKISKEDEEIDDSCLSSDATVSASCEPPGENVCADRNCAAGSSSSKLAMSQALAQTIVNAFCEKQKDNCLVNSYIPSFMATERNVTIMMYNCQEDKLLMSNELSIWDNSGSLNMCHVIQIWLALNFEHFPTDIDLIEPLPMSNFQKLVGCDLSVYNQEVRRPCYMAKKHIVPEFRRPIADLLLDDRHRKALETIVKYKKILK